MHHKASLSFRGRRTQAISRFALRALTLWKRKTPEAFHVSSKGKLLQDLVLSDEAGYGSPDQSLKETGTAYRPW